MDYKVYWVGEKPAGAMTITVLDQSTGAPVNLNNYQNVRLLMVDSDNQEVDIPAEATVVADGPNGRVAFVWPRDRSLFTKPGEYVFQLEMTTPDVVVRTDAQNIVVKRLGGTR